MKIFDNYPYEQMEISMGLLGDIIGGIIESRPFGQRITSSNVALQNLYRTTYYDFGLNAPRNVQENELVPMTVETKMGKPFGFEIRGNIHSPVNFLSNDYGSIFHTLSRQMPPAGGRVWAYDIRRLDEGVLIGAAVFPYDEAYKRSEEYLQVLRLVGCSPLPSLSRVPAVELNFGRFWEEYGIPDRIAVFLDSVHPFEDRDLTSIIQLIIHKYKRENFTSVVARYRHNPLDGSLEVVMDDAPAESTPDSEPVPTSEPETVQPEDGFPYEFYRGLGLIDDEDMVRIPTILGPMRIDMTSDDAKEYLMSYQPENSAGE